MKEEALKLADELDGNISIYRESADMIRRLVEELDKKPLSNQEILKFIHEKFVKFGFEADYILDDNELIEFARAIEERHGIK